MKLTRIIQLVMTFRSPAVVMTIAAWWNLLIWLARIQATSFVLFWRLYVIRTLSIAKKLLLMYVSCNCAEFCLTRPVVQLSRETRIGTCFFAGWIVGGGVRALSNFCDFLNVVYLLSVTLGTTWRTDKLVQVPFLLLPVPFTRQKALSQERCSAELSYGGSKIVALSIWWLHTRSDKKEKSEVLATTN